MTIEQLAHCTKKELTTRAQKLGIAGCNSMTKDDLVKSIGQVLKKQEKTKAKAKEQAKPPAPAQVKASANGKHTTNGKHTPKISKVLTGAQAETAPPRPRTQKTVARDTSSESTSTQEQINRSKFDTGVPTRDLSAKMPKNLPNGYGKDQIRVMVVDPYWLCAYWELTHQSVQRAEAALAQDWHGAKPILRVCDVSSQDTTSTAESVIRDIEIHGGCNNWYVEVTQPPKSYRVDIGYLSKRGQFFVLARSNVVATPRAGVSETLDENWAEVDEKQTERLYAMSGGYDPRAGGSFDMRQLFEERLRRPMSSPAIGGASMQMGSGAFVMPSKDRKFFFELDAELIVFGRTEPGARVTLQGEVIKLRPDGTFTKRYSFPDGRQIIPAVAASADGIEERTIVLAVERNTKELEPMIHDTNGE
jgi:hypothetical protein